MSKTVVIYHSGYGHTRRLAEAVAEGAGVDEMAPGNLETAKLYGKRVSEIAGKLRLS
jgi:flavodoxin